MSARLRRLFERPGRLWPALSWVVVLAACMLSTRTAAADCGVSSYEVQGTAREAVLVEAGSLASNGHWSDAREAYLWVLARYDQDPEALFGIARVDSWGGCLKLAESEYEGVIGAHPEDADVRAGYVDLLVWRGRMAEAERTLARGLALDPSAPPLLLRKARFDSWRGDMEAAVREADAAEKGSPDDDEIRATRDRLFLGEARLTAHADWYPHGYPNIYSIAAQALHRKGRFEFAAGAQAIYRVGGGTSLVDVRYPIDVSVHPAMGWTLGLEVAPGAPAQAIPDWAERAFVIAPLIGRFDAFLSYDLWHFEAHSEFVHLFNPAIGVSLPHEVRLDLRAWGAIVDARRDASTRTKSLAGALGAQVTWSVTPRIDLALTATYGQELEPSLLANQIALLNYTGPSVGAYADVVLNRHFGVRPVAGFQYLVNGATHLAIESLEVGAYARW